MPAINYCPHITEEKPLSYWMNVAEQAAGSGQASAHIWLQSLHLPLRDSGDVPFSRAVLEML